MQWSADFSASFFKGHQLISVYTDSGGLYFYGDNAVELIIAGVDRLKGSWSVDGGTLTIKWYEFGTTVEMTIADGGETLVDEQGDCYKLD